MSLIQDIVIPITLNCYVDIIYCVEKLMEIGAQFDDKSLQFFGELKESILYYNN